MNTRLVVAGRSAARGFLLATGLQLALAAATAAQTLEAFGLTHTPLGGAQLAIDASGNLTVSSLGSSGGDGFSIDLGEFTRHEIRSTYASFPDLGTAGLFEITTRGPSGGVPDQVLVRTTLQGSASGVSVSVDFSGLGAPSQTVRVFRRGTEVAAASGVGPSIVFPDSDALAGIEIHKQAADPCDHWTVCTGTIEDVLLEGVPIDGDEVRIEVDAVGIPATHTSTYEVHAANIASFVIAGEEIALDGHFVAALDGARLQPETSGGAPVLKVCIGSSGSEAFSIDLGEQIGGHATWQPIPPGPVAGASLLFESWGIIAAGPETLLAEQSFTLAGDGMIDVAHDLSGVGAASTRVQVLSGGVLVADLPGLVAPLLRTSGWPRKCGKLGGTLECMVSCSDAGTTYVVGGTTYVGNELRLLAEGASASVDGKTRFVVHPVGIGDLVLTEIHSDPQPWTAFGTGLAGTYGPPRLEGFGLPQQGGTLTLRMTGALENRVGYHVGGLARIDAPLFGGILHPRPDALFLLVTDAQGEATAVLAAPNLPPGVPLYFQSGLLDPAAPANVAMTNGLETSTF